MRKSKYIYKYVYLLAKLFTCVILVKNDRNIHVCINSIENVMSP